MRALGNRLPGPYQCFQAISHVPSRRPLSNLERATHGFCSLLNRRYVSVTVPDSCWDLEEYDRIIHAESPYTSRVGAIDGLHLAVFNSSQHSNLHTFEQLLFESDVDDTQSLQKRVVDQVEHSHDFGLWTQLLQFRVRLFGLKGAWTIWQGLRQRNIDLPIEGPNADLIWNLTVKAAFKFNALPEVFLYAQDLYRRTSRRHDLLYDNVISLYLESGPERCFIWHRALNQIGLPAPNTLTRLVDVAVQSHTSLRSFQKLYENSESQMIYDNLITALCEVNNFDVACQWHDMLVHRQDFPTNASVAEPLRQRLALSGETQQLQKVTSELVKSGASFSSPLSKQLKPNTKISREIMNRMMGEAHGIEPIKLSDAFCARLFATKYFSLDFSMRCLASFGVEELGPLALREAAVRCRDPQAVIKEIANFKTLGVSIKDCTFSRLVIKLARESKTEILSSLLESDQHPDVLEDEKIQKRLLANYVHARDWVQVQRTMLTLSSISAEPLIEGWNTLLQAHIKLKDRHRIDQIIDDMLHNRVPVTTMTVSLSFHKFVSTKDTGTPPVSPSVRLEELHFFTMLWLRVLRCGGHIPATAWNQVLNYYGNEKRINDLHRLSYWLADVYSKHTMPATPSSSPDKTELAATSSPGSPASHPLTEIFTPSKIKSIMLWTSLGSPVSEEKWARGLLLLRGLRERGVRMRTEDVRGACRHVLRALFRRTDKKHQRGDEDRKTAGDPYTLEQVIRRMNEIWGGPTLVAVSPSLMDGNGKQAASALRRHIGGLNSKGVMGRVRYVFSTPMVKIQDDPIRHRRRKKLQQIVDQPKSAPNPEDLLSISDEAKVQ